MKRFSLLILIIFVLPNINSNFTSSTALYADEPKQAIKAWTVMCYMSGDCDLEAYMLEDVNELEVAAYNENLNIIVQFDYNSTGSITSTYIYELSYDLDMETIISSSTHIGEKDMGDPTTLADFIDYCQTNYPAENYFLIEYGHSSGVMYGNYPGGVSIDHSTGGYPTSMLTFAELASVLSTRQVDLVSLISCLVGGVEVAYTLQDAIDLILFSEESMLTSTFTFESVLKNVNNETTAAKIAKIMVPNYVYNCPWLYATQSAVNLTSLSTLTEVMTSLCTSLNGYFASEYVNIEEMRDKVEVFGQPYPDGDYDKTGWYIDLFDFCVKVVEFSNESIIISKAQNVMTAIDEIVIAESHKNGHWDAHGLSIYFPYNSDDYFSNYATYYPWTTVVGWADVVYKWINRPWVNPPSLQINNPQDITCEEVNNGESIIWFTEAVNLIPSHYEIYQDSSLVHTDTWDVENISYSLNGLSIGNYDFTIVLNDSLGDSVSDEVNVNVVVDSIPPTIDQPENVTLDFGSLKNITWTGNDANPSYYEIYQNGTLLVNDTWNSSEIEFWLNNLEAGVHNLTIVIYDIRNQKVSDTVMVKVIPPPVSPTTTTEKTSSDGDSPSFLWWLIILSMLILSKKNRKGIKN